jgi:hypothetical protein
MQVEVVAYPRAPPGLIAKNLPPTLFAARINISNRFALE